jgi:hypothetical protein
VLSDYLLCGGWLCCLICDCVGTGAALRLGIQVTVAHVSQRRAESTSPITCLFAGFYCHAGISAALQLGIK